jgi:hypothetical protein
MDEIINQETPIIQNPPIQEKPIKKKPSVWIWIISIFSIIIILLFYIIFKQQQIKDIAAPTEAPTPTIITPIVKTTPTIILKKQDDMVDWETYNNDKYGITFKYPKNWGEITVKEKQTYSVNSENLSNNPELKDRSSNEVKKMIEIKFLNLNKINTERKMTQIPLYFTIHPYDLNNYLILHCYEGMCTYKDILKEKNNILQKSNIATNNYKGYVSDGYFTPGANFYRKYKFISENNYMEITSGFYLNILDISLQTKILNTEISTTNTYNNKILFLEDILNLSEKTNNIIETKNLLFDINIFFNSIKTSK